VPKPILVLATQNAKKRAELEAMAGEDLRVQSLEQLGLEELEIVEDADTFQGNAHKKAAAVLAALEERGALKGVFAVLADDSGLCVDALAGAPGVRSARFAEDHERGSGDEANNDLLLERLFGVADEERGARFVCAISVLLLDGREIQAAGEVEGRIGHERRGAGGFGYDPLFFPTERPGVTTAELSADEKHAISHRGRAVREAMALLRSLL
jgi:XTP/dITP diphosphohydrolase